MNWGLVSSFACCERAGFLWLQEIPPISLSSPSSGNPDLCYTLYAPSALAQKSDHETTARFSTCPLRNPGNVELAVEGARFSHPLCQLWAASGGSPQGHPL